MTRRQHLKALVRARMSRTGESYSTARAQLARRARGTVSSPPVVVVPISDVDRSTAFYSDGLGLPVRSMSPEWVVIGSEGELVALEPGGTVGIDLGIGLKVGDLAAAVQRVVASGGTVESQTGPSARVRDPDGNVVRLLGNSEPRAADAPVPSGTDAWTSGDGGQADNGR